VDSHTSVLLDMDGVLVDNIDFEQAVTDFIVDRLAAQLDTRHENASTRWQWELHETKSDPQWFDYDFHCLRLGLPGLAREAHEACVSALRLVPGAEKTLALLAKADMPVGVVSDAMAWVVQFKFAALGLLQPAFVVSSEQAGAPKSSHIFWESFKKNFPEEAACIFVDNRLVNLHIAGKVIPNMDLICFVGDEHALRLSGIIEPNRYPVKSSENPITVVADHAELTDCIIERLLAGPR
jgi:FMN phosphatase YigB (HAD superfamily)